MSQVSCSKVKVGDFANCSRTVTMADLGEVVPRGMVLDTTIVPEHDSIGFPPDPDLEVDTQSDVLTQHVEYYSTLRPAEFLDSAGEGRIYIERLAAGQRVGADHRMDL